MRLKILLTAILLYTASLSSAQAVIAYYNGDGEDINEYHIGKLTHIIFSFGHLKDGVFCLQNARDSTSVMRLVALKQLYPSLKVQLSLGGWGGCETCSAAFSTEAGREGFAKSVLAATRYFHTDGIDIDWEYPGLPAFPGHAYQPADRENFTALMQCLRKWLGNRAEISFATAAFTGTLPQSIDLKSVMPFVNRVGIMTYDYVDEGTPVTSHLTPLYSTSKELQSADYTVRFLDSLKVPLSKVIIGAAFYGREFDGVADINHGLYQPGACKRFIPFRQIHKLISNQQSGYKTYFDKEAGACYSYNAQQKKFLTYDGERSVMLKTAYVRKKRLGGIMFWELDQDMVTGGLVDVIYNTLNNYLM